MTISSLVLYEPPFVTEAGRLRSYAARARLNELVASDDRAAATRFFLADIMGAPRAFVSLMPIVMPRSGRRNKAVAHTPAYDLAILDRSVRHSSLATRRRIGRISDSRVALLRN